MSRLSISHARTVGMYESRGQTPQAPAMSIERAVYNGIADDLEIKLRLLLRPFLTLHHNGSLSRGYDLCVWRLVYRDYKPFRSRTIVTSVGNYCTFLFSVSVFCPRTRVRTTYRELLIKQEELVRFVRRAKERRFVRAYRAVYSRSPS